MDVQAHVVAQAVRLEEAGDAEGDHLVQVAVHEAEGGKAFQHLAGGRQMHLPVGDARPY